VTTLAAGSTLVFLVATLVTRWGVGNGFCLIILLDSIGPALAQAHNSVPTDPVFGNLLEVLAWMAAVGLLVRRFARRQQAAFEDSRQETIPLVTLPAFPQGILPVLWAYSVIGFLSSLPFFHALRTGVGQSPIGLLLMTILIAAFSFGAFHLFSGRKRLERNLPPDVLPPEGEVIPRHSLLQSTALLVVLGVSFPAGEWFLGSISRRSGCCIRNGIGFGIRPRCRMALSPQAWQSDRVSYRNGQRLLRLLPAQYPRKAGVRIGDSCFPLPLAILRRGADRQDAGPRAGGRIERSAGDHPAGAH
jgi:hypothetical protein